MTDAGTDTDHAARAAGEGRGLYPDDSPVLARVVGGAGHIVLNRPRAINALTHEMVGLIARTLQTWEHDDAVRTVVLTGAGERGLCAGGDIVALYRDATDGDGRASAQFWADEYRLDHAISVYPKPFVAIMDGIVLGGGIGLSAHAAIRVVTERSSIGMPETGIGFIPDVGGTWLLSHTPGQTGTHLGLTAGSVQAGDAIALGLADHYVTTDALPALLEALEGDDVDALAAVREAAGEPPASPLSQARSWIDEAYAPEEVTEILARLDASGVPEAAQAAATIRRRSPTSLALTLRALRAAATMSSLGAALDQEYRLATRVHAGHDFAEGVRAQVVDKDRNPRWDPARPEDVDPAAIEAYFAPLGPDELGLGPDEATTTGTPHPEKETS